MKKDVSICSRGSDNGPMAHDCGLHFNLDLIGFMILNEITCSLGVSLGGRVGSRLGSPCLPLAQ